MGRRYEKGKKHLEVDIERAIAWYEQAAALGSSDAMDRLGNIYDQGKSVK